MAAIANLIFLTNFKGNNSILSDNIQTIMFLHRLYILWNMFFKFVKTNGIENGDDTTEIMAPMANFDIYGHFQGQLLKCL